jgi:hypothetical protein
MPALHIPAQPAPALTAHLRAIVLHRYRRDLAVLHGKLDARPLSLSAPRWRRQIAETRAALADMGDV